MNEREVAEIRRRWKPERHNVGRMYGCYVNEKREVVALFGQSPALMPAEEAERYFALFKCTLSGTLNKNLVDIAFTTQQVMGSPEHKLLTALNRSALKDEDAVKQFFDRVINNLAMDGQYIILLAHDTYDVPYRGGDGADNGAGDEVFSYTLCSICPVKQIKPSLRYSDENRAFVSLAADRVVAAPELGFMFPCFDGRRSNIYNALCYTHDTASSHSEFIGALFGAQAPMPAEEQKSGFCGALGNALAEDCSLEVVQTLHEQMCEKMEEYKAAKSDEPLMISKREVTGALRMCGVKDEHIDAFAARYDDMFGENAELSPRNLIDTKKMQLNTPDVRIQVNPARSDLIETRVINGVKYILICVDDGVEVNGIPIRITEKDS